MTTGERQAPNPDWILAQVARHAEAMERERRQMLGAIRRAHKAGASLRAIGKAAGLSHQRIHQLLRESDAGAEEQDHQPPEPPEPPRDAPTPSKENTTTLTWI